LRLCFYVLVVIDCLLTNDQQPSKHNNAQPVKRTQGTEWSEDHKKATRKTNFQNSLVGLPFFMAVGID
jgi:hypothetical protein